MFAKIISVIQHDIQSTIFEQIAEQSWHSVSVWRSYWIPKNQSMTLK